MGAEIVVDYRIVRELHDAVCSLQSRVEDIDNKVIARKVSAKIRPLEETLMDIWVEMTRDMDYALGRERPKP